MGERYKYAFLKRFSADFLKHNNKGVKAMCEIMQKLQDEGRIAGIIEGRIEGRNEMATNTALKMLRFNEPVEKIISYTSLSEERIKELAQQIH